MVSQDGRLGQQSTSPRATTMRRSTIGPRQGRSGVNESAAQVLSELLTSLSLTTGGDKRSTGLGTLSTMMCIVTCVLIPVQASFDEESPTLWILTYLLDAYFLVEWSMSVRQAVHQFQATKTESANLTTATGEHKTRHSRIALFIDAMSLAPFEIFAPAVVGWPGLHSAAMMRLNRLLRLWRVLRFLARWEGQLNANILTVQTTTFVILLSLFTHWQACTWHMMGCYGDDCKTRTWITQGHETHGGFTGGDMERYVDSLYWSFTTMTSTGYGDVRAVNLGEKCFAIVTMLLGVLFFGYIFGTIASTLANADASRASYAENCNKVQHCLNREGVEPELRKRTQRYMEYNWQRKGGSDCALLFRDIPTSLQAEVALGAYASMFDKSATLSGCEEGIKRMLALKVRTVLYLPGEKVVLRGHICDNMYYIYRGAVEVRDSSGVVQKVMQEGSLFGEIPMILAYRSSVETTAVFACDLFVLDKGCLDEVVSHYPQLKQQIEARAQTLVDTAVAKEAARVTTTVATLLNTNAHPAPPTQNSACKKLQEREGNNVVSPKRASQKSSNNVEAGEASDQGSSPRITAFDVVFGRIAAPVVNFTRHHPLLKSTVFITFMAISIVGVTLEAAWTTQSVVFLTFTYVFDVLCLTCFLGELVLFAVNIEEAHRPRVWSLLAQSVAAIPLELFFIGHNEDAISAARLNRIFRLVAIYGQFQHLEILYSIRATTVRCSQLLVIGFLALHTAACLWILAHRTTAVDPNYVTALYWVLATTTSTGYGDEYPRSGPQRLYSMAVMLLGQSGFGLASATIAAILANLATSRLQAQSHLNAVSGFLDGHHIDEALQLRIREHFRQQWTRFEGLDDVKAFRTLPRSLQAEINDARYQELLSEFPLFKNVPDGLTHEVMLKLRRIFILPNETIITKDDIGKKAYFIVKGVVDIMADDGVHVAAHLTSGQYFGELGMLFCRPRLNSIRAASHCELVSLSRDDLVTAARHYPAFLNLLDEILADDVHFAAGSSAIKLNDQIAVTVPLRQTNEREVASGSTLIRHRNAHKSRFRSKNQVTPIRDDTFPNMDGLDRIRSNAKWQSLLLMTTTLNPFSETAYVWEILQIVTSTLVVFTVPYYAAFAPSSTMWWGFHVIIDVIFLLDIYVKAHTAYIDSDGELQSHSHDTALHYAKGGFTRDILTALPIDLVLTLTVPAYAPIGRFNRIFRAYKPVRYLNALQSGISSCPQSSVRSLTYVLVASMILNVTACLWMLLGCFNECGAGWTSNTGSVDEMSPQQRYVVAVYWTVATMSSVGYGDVHATTDFEKFFALSVMLLGTLLYSCYIATSAASIANADFQRSRYAEKVDALQHYLHQPQVDRSIATRATNHYEYVWMRNRGERQHTLFAALPDSIHADLCMEIYQEAISRVPLFSDVGIGFTRLLSMVMKPELVLASEYIVRKGDIGLEMYFIHTGAVDVVSEDGEVTFATMTAGAFFGEISLVRNCPRTASIRAASNADLFVLTKKDLEEVLDSFPDIRRKINEEADQRIKKVQERQNSTERNSPTTSTSQEKVEPTAAELDPKKEFRIQISDEDEAPDVQDSENNATRRAQVPVVKKEVVDDKPVKENEVEDETSQNSSGSQRLIPFVVSGIFRPYRWILTRIGVPIILHRTTKYARYWEWLFLTAMIVTGIVIPFESAFIRDATQFTWPLHMVLEMLFLVEMTLNFHTTINLKNGQMLQTCDEIAVHYVLNGSFYRDATALIPIDLIMLAVGSPWAWVFRFPKLLRVCGLFAFVSRWLAQLKSPIMLLRTFRCAIMTILTAHGVACAWYIISCPDSCPEPGWVSASSTDDDAHPSRAQNYVNALYWTMATMTTTGYGDFRAHNDAERIFSICVMIGGKILFGSIFANVASTQANADYQRIRYRDKMLAVRDFFQDRQVSADICTRISRYYEYLWTVQKGWNVATLFEDMPYTLQADIFCAISQDYIQLVPVLRQGDSGFTAMLSMQLRPEYFLRGDWIAKSADISRSIIFVAKGYVEVVVKGVVVKVKHPGSYFGDDTAISGSPHRESYRAATAVEVLVLPVEKLTETLAFFPRIREKIEGTLCRHRKD